MDEASGRIKSYLLRERIVTRDQLARVESHANRENAPLLKALLDLKLIGESDIGKCMSAASELPYKPLLAEPPPAAAKNMLSLQCASRWKVFPSDYDPDEHVLTLAIHDTAQIPKLDRIYQFLAQPDTLAFLIAPAQEIEKAIDVHLAGKSEPPTAEAAKPVEARKTASMPDEPRKPLKLSGLRSAAEGSAPPSVEQKPALEPGRAAPLFGGAKQEKPAPLYTREDMSAALTSAAALLAEAHLESNVERLNSVRERVRYCQLLASRLAVPPIETDRLLFAAWLSGLEDKPQIIKQFVNPYEVEKTLSPSNKSDTASLILALVKSYQELRNKYPSSCEDINLTRRNIRLVWSCPPERNDMLETFLQLLMDEQFLARAGRPAAKAGVSGSLEDMSFTDMIQILSVGGKSIELCLAREGREGRVFLKNGEIIHAAVGAKQGEEAFHALMQWKQGEFTTKQCGEFPERTIHSSTMSLLMEGARLGDEGLVSGSEA